MMTLPGERGRQVAREILRAYGYCDLPLFSAARLSVAVTSCSGRHVDATVAPFVAENTTVSPLLAGRSSR